MGILNISSLEDNMIVLDKGFDIGFIDDLIKSNKSSFIIADENNYLYNTHALDLISSGYTVFKVTMEDYKDKIREVNLAITSSTKFAVFYEFDIDKGRPTGVDTKSSIDFIKHIWEDYTLLTSEKVNPNHVKWIIDTRLSQASLPYIRAMFSQSKEMNISLILFENDLRSLMNKYQTVYNLLIVDSDRIIVKDLFKKSDLINRLNNERKEVMEKRKNKESIEANLNYLKHKNKQSDKLYILKYDQNKNTYTRERLKIKKKEVFK